MTQENMIGKKVATVAAGLIITTTIVAIKVDEVQVVAELDTGAVVPIISLLVLQ